VPWRSWERFAAGIYDRGAGEGVWHSDQHCLVFSVRPTLAMLLQIDGGSVQEVRQAVGLMSLYPAGPTIRSVGADSRYAQVCWNPSLYQIIAPDLPRLPPVERAKALLQHGEENLAEVAVVVDFADQSHFTAAFRRETGTTPGRFRTAAA